MTAPAVEDAIGRAVAEALAVALPDVVDRLVEIGGPRAYSVIEVARRLDLSETSVRTLIRDGHLPTVPHLNPARISAAALAEFLAACHRQKAS